MNQLFLIIVIIFPFWSCSAQQLSNDSNSRINEILQGKWRMIQDSSATIFFVHDTMIDFYEDTLVSYEIFKITSRACDTLGLLTKGTGFYIESYVHEIKDTMCYSITFLNEKHLELVYLAGGRILNFKRELQTIENGQ